MKPIITVRMSPVLAVPVDCEIILQSDVITFIYLAQYKFRNPVTVGLVLDPSADSGNLINAVP